MKPEAEPHVAPLEEKPEAEPHAALEAEPHAVPEVKPESEPHAVPEVKPESEPHAAPGVKPEAERRTLTSAQRRFSDSFTLDSRSRTSGWVVRSSCTCRLSSICLWCWMALPNIA